MDVLLRVLFLKEKERKQKKGWLQKNSHPHLSLSLAEQGSVAKRAKVLQKIERKL